MRAPTLRRKLALTAKVQDEVGHAQLLYRVAEDLGKPREAMFDDLLAGQDEVPQRLPLPDPELGRRRDHRLAGRRRGDRRPAGAARLVLCPVRPDDAQDLLGGVGPHHARARRRGDACHRDAGPAGDGPGGARPVVGTADADARPADAAREGPRPGLADQGEDERGAAPGVPRDLRAADPRARPDDPRPGAPATTRLPASGATAEPDWDELRTVVTNHGPMSQERLEFRRLNREETRWVRESILGAPRAILGRMASTELRLRPRRASGES